LNSSKVSILVALMTKKPDRKPDNPEQSKRFIETAKVVGADDPQALDRAFKKVASQKADKKDKR
jgi:hypothetical protein